MASLNLAGLPVSARIESASFGPGGFFGTAAEEDPTRQAVMVRAEGGMVNVSVAGSGVAPLSDGEHVVIATALSIGLFATASAHVITFHSE